MKNLKLSIIVLILVSFLTSCGSRKGYNCKKRYVKAVIESTVKEVDRCFLVLNSGDTLRNIPKEYVFSEDDAYKFIVRKRLNFKCEVVQIDLIDLRV